MTGTHSATSEQGSGAGGPPSPFPSSASGGPSAGSPISTRLSVSPEPAAQPIMSSASRSAETSSFWKWGRLATMYEDCGFLGAGSFGQVRKMKQSATGKMFAVKSQLVDMDDVPATHVINAESAILATLAASRRSHALVNTEELLYDPPHLYIVMELLDNDLAKYIRSRKAADHPFSDEEAWSCFAQLVDALAEIHSSVDHTGRPQSIVLHRDVKPGNILIDKDGFYKLGDFGLSKLLVDEYTQTACGTRAYMSPEQLDGRPYTAKSDVYSLGVVIHELCSFSCVRSGALERNACRRESYSLPFGRSYGSRDPRRVPALPARYSRSLDALVKQMISHNADDRPSAAELQKIPQIAKQLLETERKRRELEHARRLQELTERERTLEARERALAIKTSDAAPPSDREAWLNERERHISQMDTELLQNAKMLSERVQATNTALETMHERLLLLASTAGIPITVNDDRETIFNALHQRLVDLQQGSHQNSVVALSNGRGSAPSVRVGASLMLDALSAKMRKFAKSVDDQSDLSDAELEDNPMAALRVGLRQIALNLKGPFPTDDGLAMLPGAMPNGALPMRPPNPHRQFSPTDRDSPADATSITSG